MLLSAGFLSKVREVVRSEAMSPDLLASAIIAAKARRMAARLKSTRSPLLRDADL